jgi:RNAse (barnase) inhibitor barstar
MVGKGDVRLQVEVNWKKRKNNNTRTKYIAVLHVCRNNRKELQGLLNGLGELDYIHQ